MHEETKRLQQEIKLLKTLGTRQGFFHHYFEQLPHHRNQVECFNAVNDHHLELFGEERFSDYNSFRRSLTYYHNNKK